MKLLHIEAKKKKKRNTGQVHRTVVTKTEITFIQHAGQQKVTRFFPMNLP